MYTLDCVKMRRFLLNGNCQWELGDTKDAILLHVRSKSIAWQVLKYFCRWSSWAIYHAPSTNNFYSDHFPFQFKSSDRLNLTRKTEIQLATFLFWKIIIQTPYDVALGEHQIRHPVSQFYTIAPWAYLVLCAFFFFQISFNLIIIESWRRDWRLVTRIWYTMGKV